MYSLGTPLVRKPIEIYNRALLKPEPKIMNVSLTMF